MSNSNLNKKEKVFYLSVKDELTRVRESVKYFSPKFFEEWLKYTQLVLKGEPMDKILAHMRRHIFTTPFYNSNSGAYCVFLEIMNARKKEVERLIGG